MTAGRWPALEFARFRDTALTLPRVTQIVGKVRLARTPWLNHSWHVPLYVTARGLSTGPIPHERDVFDIELDFIDHAVVLRVGDGATRKLALDAVPIAEHYARLMTALEALQVPVTINRMPNEIADAIPFDRDSGAAAYDADAANAFWRVLVSSQRVLGEFRTGFVGKSSPVHFFWGSFDLAVTRFSGRPAPRHPGGVPNLPDAVVREAYSHEVSSAGFWPGGGSVDYAAFYSYAYPEPPGFRSVRVAPAAAFFSEPLGEFLLPYEAVRGAADPDATLMAFLESTYAAAADRAGWDRAALECVRGRPRVPRIVA